MSGLSNLDVVSIKSLENLQQFGAFFDMIKNPEKYSEIVKLAKEVLTDLEEIVGPYKTVEAANQLLTDTKARVEVQLASLDKKEQEAKERADKIIAAASEIKTNAEKVNQEAQAKLQAAEQLQKQLDREIEAFNVKKADLETRLYAAITRETELRNKEKDLEQKAAQLKAILGA